MRLMEIVIASKYEKKKEDINFLFEKKCWAKRSDGPGYSEEN